MPEWIPVPNGPRGMFTAALALRMILLVSAGLLGETEKPGRSDLREKRPPSATSFQLRGTLLQNSFVRAKRLSALPRQTKQLPIIYTKEIHDDHISSFHSKGGFVVPRNGKQFQRLKNKFQKEVHFRDIFMRKLYDGHHNGQLRDHNFPRERFFRQGQLSGYNISGKRNYIQSKLWQKLIPNITSTRHARQLQSPSGLWNKVNASGTKIKQILNLEDKISRWLLSPTVAAQTVFHSDQHRVNRLSGAGRVKNHLTRRGGWLISSGRFKRGNHFRRDVRKQQQMLHFRRIPLYGVGKQKKLWEKECRRCSSAGNVYDGSCFNNITYCPWCNCQNKGPCNPRTAECVTGPCAYGWSSANCSTNVCPRRTFAPYRNCSLACDRDCLEWEACHPLTGECYPLGNAQRMATVCPRKKFGDGCKGTCHCWGNRICNPNNGSCPDGVCESYYGGTKCGLLPPKFEMQRWVRSMFYLETAIIFLKLLVRTYFIRFTSKQDLSRLEL